MATLVDLITQVKSRLPKRFGGTGNQQGWGEGVIVPMNARSTIPLYSVVKVSAADYRVAATSTNADVDAIGVTVGRYDLLAGDIEPRFVLAAASNAQQVAVMLQGISPVRVTGSVTRDQYAFPSATSGLAYGSNFGPGALGRFLADGSNSVSALIGALPQSSGPPSGKTYGRLILPPFSTLDVTGELYSRGGSGVFALEVDPDLLQVDAAQVKVADAGAKYTAPSPASGTETLRPTSDVEASAVTYSTGSVMYTLVDESVLDTGDYVGVNPGGYGIVGMAASARPQSNEIANVTLKVYVSAGWAGDVVSVVMRDPQLGTRHDVSGSVSPGLQTIVRTTRPWDSRPWTLHDVRHLQAGVTYGSGGTGAPQMAQVYCEVNWTAPKTVETVLAEIVSGSASVATDPIWDVKGDLAVGTGANTAARLAAGSNGQFPLYDSTQTTGMRNSGTGPVYIGAVANAKNTLGLTVNQGAADDEILSAKSSDVAHGMTGITETDTYLFTRKYDAASGGSEIWGLTEDNVGQRLVGAVTNSDTTRSGSGVGPFVLEGTKKSGTSITSLAAGDNVVVIRNNGATVLIIGANGSIWSAVGNPIAFVSQAKWFD